ncbi:carbamoyltransferase N-terminal domain-containing protein [Streptomyces sp. NPDC059455]|uniref:carbamoyltransferase N-terminal domain-containing protein n=1 Tax=Streptomyces sp. NPDC059455 TaxID=3346837 RepID=UPI00369415FC
MIFCGLKLTHDGAVALIDGDRLVFSVEMEKIGNGKRYSWISDLSIIPRILDDFGYKPEDVDEWVIDGWDGDQPRPLFFTMHDNGNPVEITVAPYRECPACPDLLQPGYSDEFTIDGRSYNYTSYAHAAGHLSSTYCTSPFARRGEPAFVLVWDGGLFPALYLVDPDTGVRNLGDLFPLLGHAYAIAGQHFGPFRKPGDADAWDLTVAGKLMAYIALGSPRESVLAVLREEFHRIFESDLPQAVEYRRSTGGFGSPFEPSVPPVHEFYAAVRMRTDPAAVSDEDVLASIHQFFEDLLCERITGALRMVGAAGPVNLCFAGGCALNIKWNSALRALPAVREMWVPPFPNDSGSAIGAAALGRVAHAGLSAIEWSTRLGPDLLPVSNIPAGWSARPCPPAELARLLYETGDPVVVLNGRAELGPRALGGRSILAAPTDIAMKDELNRIKAREPYRPVAPICLVDAAPEIFDPGTPDPYMLFDHDVRPDWADHIPAVVHLDGTARLQTVDPADDPVLGEVLAEYHRLSGIPVLCNTSANLNGSGFFPDVVSAIEWGQVDRVWSAGTLYQRHSG